MFGHMFRRNYSIEELSEIVGPIARRHNISKVYLFGSRARGDNRRDSDFDMIVETAPGFRLFDLFAFQDELEAILKYEVDAMTTGALRDDNFSRTVLRERVRIYG